MIVLQTGSELCVDTLVEFERTFLVLRGRVGGTIEEARAFFVPYDQMLCLRLERIVRWRNSRPCCRPGPAGTRRH